MYRVLVADDEDKLRRNLTMILNSEGFSTNSVRSCEEGIALFKKRAFDVLITDLVMPEKGGAELIKYVVEHFPNTHIIIMTAYPTANSAIDAINRGVVNYFTKPFNTKEMVMAVSKAIELRKSIPFVWEKLNQFKVTSRELTVLKVMVEGGISENIQIAAQLGIKSSTVKQHLDNLFAKFMVNNRTALLSAVINALRT